tara:strand:- start:3695 stop:4042 length:348 start_codon:yes stop_codon:yes gene_type:complete
MTITVYGIPNCDTVKKARVFLADQGHEFSFHDFRKAGLEAAQIEGWLSQQPMDVLLNKRGTSWRKLSDADKEKTDTGHLVALMVGNPTLIKRPVIERDGVVSVGFSKDVQTSFSA